MINDKRQYKYKVGLQMKLIMLKKPEKDSNKGNDGIKHSNTINKKGPKDKKKVLLLYLFSFCVQGKWKICSIFFKSTNRSYHTIVLYRNQWNYSCKNVCGVLFFFPLSL